MYLTPTWYFPGPGSSRKISAGNCRFVTTAYCSSRARGENASYFPAKPMASNNNRSSIGLSR